MKLTSEDIQKVANGISNYFYNNNLEATKQLMDLFERITKKFLNTCEDYIQMYDDNFYTYQTFDELVKSEEEINDGLTREECMEQLNKSIWQLPCGWYVQYV